MGTITTHREGRRHRGRGEFQANKSNEDNTEPEEGISIHRFSYAPTRLRLVSPDLTQSSRYAHCFQAGVHDPV